MINREKSLDIASLEKLPKLPEYGSNTVKHLSVKELKDIMQKLNWVL